MGSKPKQVDSAVAGSSSKGADAAAQASASLSNENRREQEIMFGNLFGTDGKGGSLGGFLDPSKLNVSQPTGVFAQQYGRARAQNAQNMSNQRGMMSRDMANRGFGMDSPNGMQADNYRKLALGQADQEGQLFTNATNQSYSDALQKFNMAVETASGQADSSRAGALQGSANAGQTYGNLYGTAGQQAKGSGMGAALMGAGAQMGAAAICPVEGSFILMHDGSEKKAEDIQRGDLLMGIDGAACPALEDARRHESLAVKVSFNAELDSLVSRSHCYALANGGYTEAIHVGGYLVKTLLGNLRAQSVEPIGLQTVILLEVGGSHTYCADGVWALS